MQQSPSWEANPFSATQTITCILWISDCSLPSFQVPTRFETRWEHGWLCLANVVRCLWKLLRWADPSSRGVLPSVVCLSVISKPQQWGGPGLNRDCCPARNEVPFTNGNIIQYMTYWIMAVMKKVWYFVSVMDVSETATLPDLRK